MEHVLGTVLANPTLGLLEGVSFYRADAGRPFSEAERLFQKHLVEHLVETCYLNRLASVQTDRRQAVSTLGAMAICDRKDVLYAAGPEFANLMQSEWPAWHGPLMPAGLSAKHPPRHVGEQIVVTIEKLNDLRLVRARRRLAIDHLSVRELDVARKFAEGFSYHDLAAAMHISPATVRNHLKNIYAKLGVGDKAALANLVRRG
jgi:DNA-binding CsgD family transcriptional regulator